ncbi:MAG: LptF/LptG family permease [Bacteroidota bacterium]
MKKLHLLIIRSYLGPFILTFFIAVFVLLMQFLWKYIDDLVGKGLEIGVLSELLFYASATFVPMALPLAILLSSLMTFGNLGENYELVALKSAGISLQRTMFPLVIVSILISLSAFFFSNNVLPIANLKFYSLLSDIRNQRPELNIRPGIFYDKIDNYIIKVSSKNKKSNMLYKVMIYDHTGNNGNTNITISDSASMMMTADKNYLILNMYNGCKYEELPEEGRKVNNSKSFPHQSTHFISESIMLDLSGFGLKRTDEELFKENQEMLNVNQLKDAKDSLILEFEDRKESFGKNILQTNYYKRPIIQDSMIVCNETEFSYNIDSLFRTFQKSDMVRIIESAQNFARSTQTYVSTTAMDYVYREKWISKYDIELHRKYSLSFACLVLFFIGAPLGAIIRKGGLGMPVVVATLFFIFYYIISITGEKTVKQGLMPAYQGMWLSAAVLLPLGVFLTYKATADSVLFDIDSYKDFIKRFFRINFKRNLKLYRLYNNVFVKEDYTNDKIIFNLKEMQKNCHEYSQNHLKINFIKAARDLIQISGRDQIFKIFELYDYLLIYMVEKSKQNSYFKNKLNELPLLNKSLHKRGFVKLLILVILIPVFPLVVIYHMIERQAFKRKLSTIINVTGDIINVIENPDLLELKRI